MTGASGEAKGNPPTNSGAGGNWARLNEADSDTTALANTIKARALRDGTVVCESRWEYAEM